MKKPKGRYRSKDLEDRRNEGGGPAVRAEQLPGRRREAGYRMEELMNKVDLQAYKNIDTVRNRANLKYAKKKGGS